MTKYLGDKKTSLILIIVCFLTYTIIGFTRNAYGAAIVSIISEGYFSKVDAGIIATSFSVTYCISQIIGSYFVDKISPFKIILLGTIVTIFANIVMSLNPTYWTIFIARGICGVAQFGIWPAMLRILSEFVNEKHRHTWGYILPLGIPLGSVLSYLCAAFVSEWRGLFTVSYIAMAVATVVFVVTTVYAQKRAVCKTVDNVALKNNENENCAEQMGLFRMLTASGLLFLLIPMFLRALVSNGIGNWMPTMIMESYNTTPAISSIMTTITTCANFGAVLWVMILYPRVFKLQTTATGMIFAFMVPFLAATVFVGKLPVALIVVFITIVNTFMGSIHQFCTVEIPRVYTKYNRAGMVAGIINAVVTMSGVVAGWLWGFLSERYSWNVIAAIWAAIALISAVCCFAVTPLWKKFVMSK